MFAFGIYHVGSMDASGASDAALSGMPAISGVRRTMEAAKSAAEVERLHQYATYGEEPDPNFRWLSPRDLRSEGFAPECYDPGDVLIGIEMSTLAETYMNEGLVVFVMKLPDVED